MARISLCMIVKNEASMLAGCLASVHGLVDEMIVVDTGSTDETVAIALREGAKVYHHPWADDFSAPRNVALQHATGSYVLILDADERIAPASKKKLRRAIAQGDFDCGMIRLHDALRVDASTADVLSGVARQGDPVRVPRVLRRTPDLAFEGIIHESVTAWLTRRGRSIQFMDADIVHLGGAPDLRARLKKSERNIALLQRRTEAEPNDQLVWGFLAHELLNAGQSAEAWTAVERGWQHIDRCDRSLGESILRLATARARIQLEGGRTDDVLATVARTEIADGAHPDLDHLRGLAYEYAALRAHLPAARTWRLSAAVDAYRAGLARRDMTYAQNFVVGATTWAGQTRLGTALLLNGDPVGAHEAFRAAVELKPGHREAIFGMAEALINAADPAGALRTLEKFLGPEPDGWLLAGIAADALGSLADAKTFLMQSYNRSEVGFAAPHRRERLAGMIAAVGAYMGRPAPGPGTSGIIAALLAGAPVPEVSEGTPPDRVAAVRFIVNMARVGRGAALGRLLGPRAESLLPGLGAIVQETALAMGLSVPEVPTPLPVWIEAPQGPARQLLVRVLRAHPGLVVVAESVPGGRAVRFVAVGHSTPAGSTSLTYEELLAEPRREIHRLTAALGLPRHVGMIQVLADHYPGQRNETVAPWNNSCSVKSIGDRDSTGSHSVHSDPVHEVHA